MGRKLSQIELHELFLQDIFPYAEGIENMTKKPLMFKLRYPYICYVKAYLFNCTAPPGGRSIDEYKVQLILDREFAYSSNIQIYLRQILETLTHEVYVHIKHNKEIVVLARRPYLLQALEKRFDIDLQVMINKSKNL